MVLVTQLDTRESKNIAATSVEMHPITRIIPILIQDSIQLKNLY